ncbi:Putative beta-lactamase-inhibitor-like, PepSY-like [Saccharicrinis carchari]|uniref:Beta-lactamase-inhibitor-like, PepSY-like n=1 Tax=Saccharicrinis carchari TaxID=1168039 RepID=A0A521EV12_SACCC|nr:PepSY-like domain-containing protein [Saccharicrinis carchari]SMO87745.1 Putative beta-lactamase-inhibitor-like, PepSY-like [Saccharicrinis carchari]
MKSIKLLAIAFLFAGIAAAQDVHQNQVPSVVVNSFKKEFPKASDVEWDRQGDQYNVEFEIGFFDDYEAWFSATGKLIRYTQDISSSKLPKAVKEAIKNQYKGYRIDDAEKITENKAVSYSVEIEKGNDELELVFSADGKLIKP